MKMHLATILRRMADRLAPMPAGDCGSVTTFFGTTGGQVTFTHAGNVASGGTFTCQPGEMFSGPVPE